MSASADMHVSVWAFADMKSCNCAIVALRDGGRGDRGEIGASPDAVASKAAKVGNERSGSLVRAPAMRWTIADPGICGSSPIRRGTTEISRNSE